MGIRVSLRNNDRIVILFFLKAVLYYFTFSAAVKQVLKLDRKIKVDFVVILFFL